MKTTQHIQNAALNSTKKNQDKQNQTDDKSTRPDQKRDTTTDIKVNAQRRGRTRIDRNRVN